ncbi:hypothetical protein [Clostridium sp.]|uniref:hypothetical protein n=1 Tax=Clostridium sp. TaxID=1506 RepID=UPI003F358E8A
MPKIRSLSRNCSIDSYCNDMANSYLVLVSIISVLIAQEIENDEDLGILASFLVALGEELALASEMRIACKERFNDENAGETFDVFDRNIHNNSKKVKKVKRKYIRKNSTSKK